MKYLSPGTLSRLLCVASILPAFAGICSAAGSSPRTVLDADRGWKFSQAAVSAASPLFDDGSWRTVNLPHDWSVEGRPEKQDPTGAGEGYFPEGNGWYRKSFTVPAAWKGKRTTLAFGGIAGDTTIYLNGVKIAEHPYAYTSFSLDLSQKLIYGTRNVLAIAVDNTMQPNSRWYSGSGIYRHVRLVLTDPVHVAEDGVFVTTPQAAAERARVVVHTTLIDDSSAACDTVLETRLIDPDGRVAGEVRASVRITAAGGSQQVQQSVVLSRPELWSPTSPRLYRAVTRVYVHGHLVDEVTNEFGVRTLEWSVERGLLLNGVSIKLAGGSVHHDNGPLGAAAYDRAEERKVELLKAAGFNAVRAAHNPPSTAFLNACDRLGMLVMDEAFDVWTVPKRRYDYARFFKEWWIRDLDSMVERDRNHPSVIFWSIGNEIPEVWTGEGASLAHALSARVHALDTSRPITQAFAGATYGESPDASIAQVDVAGYNYNLAQNGAEDHLRVPGRIMMTTESFPADAFEQWSLVHDHPHILGEFVWTAMDYLGESGIGAWSIVPAAQVKSAAGMKAFLRGYLAKMGADGKSPMASLLDGQPPSPLAPEFPWHASYCGDLDLIGDRKPSSFYRDILWNGGDRLYMTVQFPTPQGKAILAPGWAVYPSQPSWTWPGEEGKPLIVEVYSDADKVALSLNGVMLQEKDLGRENQFKAAFEVPYAPGYIKAVGYRDGRVVAVQELTTVGAPARLKLHADRSVVRADGQDLAFVTVEAADQNGQPQRNADSMVEISLTGPGTIIAVGNGDGQSLDPYSSTRFRLFHGRALVVVRSSLVAGAMTLSARSVGLAEDTAILRSQKVELAASLQ